MRFRIVLVFLSLVLVPIALLALLGVRVISDERRLVRHEIGAVEEARLSDLSAAIASTVDEIERAMLKATEGVLVDSESLRELTRREPLFRQMFVLSGEGKLIHPRQIDASVQERAFLERTRPIWMGQAVLWSPPRTESTTSSAAQVRVKDSLLSLAERAGHGWLTWYWEEGLHFLFWRKRPEGGVIGAEVERIALLSRIVGKLASRSAAEGTILLKDSRGDIIYAWANEELERSARPSVRLALQYPLDALELQYFPAASRSVDALSGSLELGFFLGLGAVLVALLILATYFYREWSRDLREAAERVRFVTQVSHELKTPLTNIRLYAELLDSELDDESSGAARRLAVIVSESQRLTRLINNILTFSKQRQNKLEIQRAPVQIDQVIEAALAQFTPLLEAKGVKVDATLDAKATVLADADAVGQILANLISNVEKYGSSGRWMGISSSQENGRVEVIVSDHGPGIAAEHQERIFAPFYRVSDKLTDGVTGTGIGLTIARELARLHGGDLSLHSGEGGARFLLTLNGGKA
jgi:signal transduction histidine kinase